MADNIKITQLPEAAQITGADILPVVSGGSTKQATVNKLFETFNNKSAFKVVLPKMYYAGTCILYIAGEKTYMVDCGSLESYGDVKDCLQDNEISHIDYFIISHYHKDHVGNVSSLINDNYITSTTTCYVPVSPDWAEMVDTSNYFDEIETRETTVNGLLTTAGCDVVTVSSNGHTVDNDVLLTFYNADLDIYSNYYEDVVNNADLSDYTHTNYNNFSMAVEFSNNGHNLLCCGDIEYIAQETLAQYMKKCDVLICPHHDSDVKASTKFISATLPRLVFQTGSQEVAPKAFGNKAMNCGASYSSENAYNADRSHEMTANGVFINNFSVYDSNNVMALPAQVIVSGDDLNDFTKEGTYYSKAGIEDNILNKPLINNAFRLEVKIINRTDGGRCQQDVYTRDGVHFIRYKTTFNNAAAWSTWQLVSDPVRSIAPGNRITVQTTKTQSGTLYLYGSNELIFLNFRNLRFSQEVTTNTPFATIPEAYRPRFSRYAPFATATKHGIICIQTNGEVSFSHLSENMGTGDYLYLDVPYFTDMTEYSNTD
ncbi:MAG: MBL fold metallo-hydrolase [Bacteroidaceae bacterium]|nr:MBL fold metallo-hydrolase [Bacteroidaceae bacterium]